jgi:hypothetical protein
MATEQINTYDPADNSPEALMTTVDEQRTGYVQLSLTNYTSTAVPAIAIGSEIEINGALFKTKDSTDPVTVGGVADGTVYILATPSGVSPNQIATFSFTATAPTWFDSKQGFYNAGGTARYVGYSMTKSGTSYTDKRNFNGANNYLTSDDNNGEVTAGGIILLGDIQKDLVARSSTTGAGIPETIPGLSWSATLTAGRFYKSVVHYELTATEQIYIFQLPSVAVRGYFPHTTSTVNNGSDTPPFPVTSFGFFHELRFRCLTSGVHTFQMRWSSAGSASRTVDERYAYIVPISTREA